MTAIDWNKNDNTTLLRDEIIQYYNKIENRIDISERNGTRNDTSVNFKKAMLAPRHRWYTYKEGFAPKFVSEFIENYASGPDTIVFDPFGGIGTTVLEANYLGLESYSNDVNPLCNFISEIKTHEYSKSDLKLIKEKREEFSHAELKEKISPPENPTVIRYFSEEVLDSILKIQFWIENHIPQGVAQNIYRLAIISLLETISTHKKDGNGVKKRKNYNDDINITELKRLLVEKINLFIDDISSTSLSRDKRVFHQCSFEPYDLPKKVDLVITSPPYANCFDYSKVYLIELWFGSFFKNKLDQKGFRDASITSHVHYTWGKRHDGYGLDIVNEQIFQYLSELKLWNKRIPNMLSGYFADMGKVLYEMKRNLNDGAYIGIVVGNSVYAGLPIATDILISKIAEKLGFKIVKVDVYRYLNPSSQQLKIMRKEDKKFLRESLIVLKWK